jgi:hypothetical protein
MSTRTSTVYKHVKEHYPISEEKRDAREHQVETPVPAFGRIVHFLVIYNTKAINVTNIYP